VSDTTTDAMKNRSWYKKQEAILHCNGNKREASLNRKNTTGNTENFAK
jgi:hypothetical protein